MLFCAAIAGIWLLGLLSLALTLPLEFLAPVESTQTNAAESDV